MIFYMKHLYPSFLNKESETYEIVILSVPANNFWTN
jgi:hypothetical protein